MALPRARWKPAFLFWNNPISIAETPTGPGGRAKTTPTMNPNSIDKSKLTLWLFEIAEFYFATKSNEQLTKIIF